ncbi:MAG: hypothetical protein JXM73_02760 [Anaerolineae bacterium]|nr:hypothetical protein [Anaerolineae bacterium]
MIVNRFSSILLGALAAASLLLAACGPAATPSQSESPLSTPTASQPTPIITEPTPAVGEPTVPPEAAEIALVKEDLAQQLKIPAEQIHVVSVRAVDWRDTSLGCPKPNMFYAEVITPGFEIILEANGQEYTYHTGGGNYVQCEDGLPVEGPTAPTSADLSPEAAALVDKAKQDLTVRAGVSAGDIVVRSIQAVEWRDGSLGCPEPGMNYIMMITPGYLIMLEAKGQAYEYHASLNNVVWCKEPKAPYSIGPAP